MAKGRNLLKKKLAREQKILAKKTKQRKLFITILAVILSIAAVAGIVYGGVYIYQNDRSIPRNQFKTEVGDDGTLTITDLQDGYDPTGKLVIPEKIDGRTVTRIGKDAFGGAKGITEVEIPQTVTSIDNLAFNNCTALKTVSIKGNSVTSIGDKAFYNCTSLQSIDINEGLESIGVEAFGKCSSLTSFTAPSTLQTIGKYAFLDCTALNRDGAVKLSASITSIGEFAFRSINKEYISAPEGSYAAKYVSAMSSSKQSN